MNHSNLRLEVDPSLRVGGLLGDDLEELLVLLVGDGILLSGPDSDVAVEAVPVPLVHLILIQSNEQSVHPSIRTFTNSARYKLQVPSRSWVFSSLSPPPLQHRLRKHPCPLRPPPQGLQPLLLDTHKKIFYSAIRLINYSPPTYLWSSCIGRWGS